MADDSTTGVNEKKQLSKAVDKQSSNEKMLGESEYLVSCSPCILNSFYEPLKTY